MTLNYAEWGRRAIDPLTWGRAWLKTSGTATVLIIDDDGLVGEMYRLALDRAGYNAVVARDGPTGLQMAAASTPGVIFLDIRMPHMDGVEVLGHLMALEATRRIPIVMLSNYDDSAFIKQCLGLGAKEYLVKVNIRPADLATVAARWINQAA